MIALLTSVEERPRIRGKMKALMGAGSGSVVTATMIGVRVATIVSATTNGTLARKSIVGPLQDRAEVG
jgi:hypothetical protein